MLLVEFSLRTNSDRLCREVCARPGDGFRQRRFLEVVRPDVQVIGRAFGNLLENRRGRLTAVIALLGFIHENRNAKLGGVRWKETDEGCEVFVRGITTVLRFLRGASLARHSVRINGDLETRPV